jgi:glutathione S-transferase
MSIRVPAMSAELSLYELVGANPEIRFSPHCWKTRMALAHKGLDAACVPWRFCDKGQGSSPNLVPVLIHGEQTVSDSWNIALHLEEQFPDGPSLFGSAHAIPLTRFVNSWADTVLIPAMARIVLLDVYGCIDAEDRAYFRSTREKYFGMSLESAVADQPTRLVDFRRALQPLRQMLKRQDFIGGTEPAYADYCVFGMLMWGRCASKVIIIEPDDIVAPWYERLLNAFDGLARIAPTV